MATHTVYLNWSTGATIYWYPNAEALTDWTTYRVAATETNSDGAYVATIPDSGWYTAFVGASQPSSFDDGIKEWYGALADNTVAIKEKTDLIGTAAATVPVRSRGTTLQLYVGETQTVTIATATDISGNTMYVEFDDVRGTSIATIADGSLTKTSTTLAFAATAAMTSAARTLTYAARDTTTEEVYLYGKCVVDYQPLA